MITGFRFAYPNVFIIGLILLVIFIIIKIAAKRAVKFIYPLTTQLIQKKLTSSHPYRLIDWIIRIIVYVLLIIVIAQPQLRNNQRKVPIDGIDIILALDMSGSMFESYDTGTSASRFQVAQEEAINFIRKRQTDALGLVIFAADAVTRCPLTHDREMLISIIQELKCDDIPPMNTFIGLSLFIAVNRLKQSQAKNKIIILLTDGGSSPGDLSIDKALEMAKKIGIKIYTIGIGQQIPDHLQLFYGNSLNKRLLDTIATQTGGASFLAQNAEDMHDIYETINQLEKSTTELPDYYNYSDLHIPFFIIISILLLVEIILQTFIWFRI